MILHKSQREMQNLYGAVENDGTQTNNCQKIICEAEKTLLNKAFARHNISKYINKIIELNHRRLKLKPNSMLGFNFFKSATVTIVVINSSK